MKLAYADPPYIEQAHKHYKHDPLRAEVDHDLLLADLVKYDGWALSCSSPSLKTILALPNCPDDVRIGAWVKPFAIFKPGINPAYAWEPVLLKPARANRDSATARDWVSEPVTTRRGLAGVKPARFCYWLFAVLGALPGDDLVDMFPGTGAVTKAWRIWQLAQREKHEQMPLFPET